MATASLSLKSTFASWFEASDIFIESIGPRQKENIASASGGGHRLTRPTKDVFLSHYYRLIGGNAEWSGDIIMAHMRSLLQSRSSIPPSHHHPVHSIKFVFQNNSTTLRYTPSRLAYCPRPPYCTNKVSLPYLSTDTIRSPTRNPAHTKQPSSLPFHRSKHPHRCCSCSSRPSYRCCCYYESPTDLLKSRCTHTQIPPCVTLRYARSKSRLCSPFLLSFYPATYHDLVKWEPPAGTIP